VIPLLNACKNENEDLVEYFCKIFSWTWSRHKSEDEDGETPLFKVCESGNKDLVEYLVEHGANINLRK